MSAVRVRACFRILALFGAAVAGREAHAVRFTVVQIPILPAKINNAGQIAGIVSGEQCNPNRGNVHAALWSRGVVTQLGPNPGDVSACTYAVDINASGQVVGYSDGNLASRAMLWSDGLATDLGTFGGYRSRANAINDAGQVVGWAETATGTRHAFLWSGGMMTDLGAPSGDYSEAWAINKRGQVLGFGGVFPTHVGPAPLSTLLWQDGVMSMVDGGFLAINDAGRTLSGPVETLKDLSAVVYCGIESVNLGGLDNHQREPAAWETFGADMNNRGQVVGDLNFLRLNIYRPFLYANGELIDLTTVVDPPDSLRLGGHAFGINDHGQIVVGPGTGSFLLTPTEPLPGPDEVASCGPPKYVPPPRGTGPGGMPTGCEALAGLEGARCFLSPDQSPPACAGARLPRGVKSRIARLRTILTRPANTAQAARLRTALRLLKQARKAALRAGRPRRSSLPATCASALDTLFDHVRMKIQDALS